MARLPRESVPLDSVLEDKNVPTECPLFTAQMGHRVGRSTTSSRASTPQGSSDDTPSCDNLQTIECELHTPNTHTQTPNLKNLKGSVVFFRSFSLVATVDIFH